jgi:5-oxoprolinase (ATP-hydrolysing)
MSQKSYLIAIDTGGTFTDCIAIDNFNEILTCKVLSNSTLRGTFVKSLNEKSFQIHNNWPVEKDIFQGYTLRLLHQTQSSEGVKPSEDYSTPWLIEAYDCKNKIIHLNNEIPSFFFTENASFEITAHEEAPILAARLITQTALHETFPPLQIRLGSTKGTNALLERKGAKTAFLVTKGFKDLLVIKNQQRPDLFALEIRKSKPLYAPAGDSQESGVIEIDERLDADGNIFKPLKINNLSKLIKELKKLKVQSIAIALMNSYRNPAHENLLKDYLKKHFNYVSISSELSQQIKFVPRAETTVVNAYLAPILHTYIKNIVSKLPDDSLRIMTSAGSLIHANLFHPKDSLLSGPAGGIVGAATIGKSSDFNKLITFDMGGTSTDVARFDDDYEYKFDVTIGTATVFSPALNIETVAAGGGSICYFDGYKLCVGPESAGATPGPACYGAGGPLTITDVNLLLGRIDTSQFGIPVFKEAALKELTVLQDNILEKTQKLLQKEEILNGFMDIANERMADAIKRISVGKGYAPPQYALVAFGGAGGLHACSMARMLNMSTILLPQYAGLLSAYGILNAKIERFSEKQILKVLSHISIEKLQNEFQNIADEAMSKVAAEGISPDNISIKMQTIYCRLKGQDAALDVPFDAGFQENFKAKYQAIYGHWIENREIEIESIRVIATETKEITQKYEKDTKLSKFSKLGKPQTKSPKPHHFTEAFVDNEWQQVPVFFRSDLVNNDEIKGFALLLDNYSTTVIEVDFNLVMDENGTAILTRFSDKSEIKQKVELSQTIDLELFINRFTNIAENMGVLLQRTALSVNVKERLDFSCALLDAQGYLIANAPHIPVHLGSLGVCVRTVLQHFSLEEGDTIVTNHPTFGGSHLPDVTLITPVYVASPSGELAKSDKSDLTGSDKSEATNATLVGYVCNRCHHSEIGGIRPASMPPDATKLVQEGVIIPPQYLVKKGVIHWESIRSVLLETQYPTRAIDENIADLNAALAANLNGVQALQALVAEQGLKTVHFYMQTLKDYTAERLKASLKARFTEGGIFRATEKLDDGSVLKVKIIIANEKVVFDFTGTSAVHKGNLNATPAIVNSVVIYVLRLLLKDNIPLNEGIMQHISLILPKNSMLNPDFVNSDRSEATNPAVVGGNVETSQRLTDALLKALGLLACGQGTMNNTLFGNETFGYYETICGGAGAGDGFNGADATHTHMTNTRITDPEIMELRYPVRLDEFSIRRNSGGKGLFKGGDGIVRRITFLAPVTLSILSQHRVVAPFGLKGGKMGKKGKQYLILNDKTVKILRGIDGANIIAGEQLVIETPGGGGFGV